MAIYELKDAQLGELKGQGYAFPIKTFQGKRYKGVFFADDAGAVDGITEEDELSFTGTVYERTRERNDTLNVHVVNTVSAGIGERLDFEVAED